MTPFTRTDRNRLRRHPERGHYDPAIIYPIIDEALICYVGFSVADQPFVIPALHARDGDDLLLHGASASRMMQHIGAGYPVSVAMALLDGLVLARSIFGHSLNYRSVVLFGRGQLITDAADKVRALRIISEHLAPGRWDEARPPAPPEVAATAVARIGIESATAKIRSGPPVDAPADLELPVWAGVVPTRRQLLSPIPAANLNPDIPLSPSVRQWLDEEAGDERP